MLLLANRYIRIMIRIGLLFLILLSRVPLSAQESIDLFTIGGQYGFPQAYESSLPEKAIEHSWNANLKVPIVLSEANIWYSEVSYYNFRVNSDNLTASDIANPISLHGIYPANGLGA